MEWINGIERSVVSKFDIDLGKDFSFKLIIILCDLDIEVLILIMLSLYTSNLIFVTQI